MAINWSYQWSISFGYPSPSLLFVLALYLVRYFETLSFRILFFNSFLSPFATRSSRYKTDATPVLYHIERCTDPACRGPYARNVSNTFYSFMNNHYVYPTSNDISSNSYTRLVQLSANTSISTKNKSDTSSMAHNRSMSENAHVSIASVKVDNTIRTTGNPGIRPPMLEAHTQKPNILLDIDNIRVSRVPCPESSNKSSLHHKPSRNSNRPCTTNQNRGSVRVTRVRSISSDIINQTTVNVPSLLNSEDTIYLDGCVDVKNDLSRTNIIGSQQLKRSPLESTSMKINRSSKIHLSGVSSTALRSQSLNLNHNHIHVERIPRTTNENSSRNSSTFSSHIRELHKQNTIRVKRVSRKTTT